MASAAATTRLCAAAMSVPVDSPTPLKRRLLMVLTPRHKGAIQTPLTTLATCQCYTLYTLTITLRCLFLLLLIVSLAYFFTFGVCLTSFDLLVFLVHAVHAKDVKQTPNVKKYASETIKSNKNKQAIKLALDLMPGGAEGGGEGGTPPFYARKETHLGMRGRKGGSWGARKTPGARKRPAPLHPIRKAAETGIQDAAAPLEAPPWAPGEPILG
eukprot:gene6951-4918_t